LLLQCLIIYKKRPEIDEEKEEDLNKDNMDEVLETDLSGLHAKLYIAEKGWDATIFTGSANATRAAFTGSNIEFMVALKGKKSRIGIDPFLGENDETSLYNMITTYHRPDDFSEPINAIEKGLESYLEKVRSILVESELNVLIFPEDDGTYELSIESNKISKLGNLPLDGICYPIALGKHHALDIELLLAGQSIKFNNISIIGLTGFIAFRLESSIDGKKAAIEFVLNLSVSGMPEDRNKRLLQNIISDSGRFIRYLLFLLADEDTVDFKVLELTRGLVSDDKSSNEILSLPLMEEMVRAYSRNPEKLKNIAKLVKDLKQTEEGRKILPTKFDLIWNAFMEVEREVAASDSK
jgi:hypothetical protein